MAAAGTSQRRGADERRIAVTELQAQAENVTEAERLLYDRLAGALGEREVAAVVRALRKLVDGGAAGDAIALRRAGG